MKLTNTICWSCKQVRQIIDGRELKKLRIEHKMSLRQLGKEVKLSAPYLHDIENNRRLAPSNLVNYWKHRTNPGA